MFVGFVLIGVLTWFVCFDYSLCLNKMFRKQQLYRINTTDTTFFFLSPLLSILSSFYPPLLSIPLFFLSSYHIHIPS